MLICHLLVSTLQFTWDQGRNCIERNAGNEDPQCVQRWQLWPLLLGLMHWSPECGKATYSAAQEAVSNTMNCITVCSTAFMAAVPAPDVTDEVRHLRSLDLSLSSQIQQCCHLQHGYQLQQGYHVQHGYHLQPCYHLQHGLSTSHFLLQTSRRLVS